jgi:prepilin-type N-terminal cleavage/methylation domain-containing protein
MSRLVRALSGQRGFTLVEVLVATVVIMVGLVAVASGFQYATSGVATGRGETVATFLAEQRIEQLKTVAMTNYAGPWPSGPSLQGGTALNNPVTTTEFCQSSNIGATSSNCQGSAITNAASYTRVTRIWDAGATLNLGAGCTGTTPLLCKRIQVSVSYRPVTSQGDASQTRTINVFAIVAPRS